MLNTLIRNQGYKFKCLSENKKEQFPLQPSVFDN